MERTCEEFRDLMDRARNGSQEAGWELVETYGPHILRVVRRMLSDDMRSKFDSTDFVQAVWASFFEEPLKLHSFQEPQRLVAYLVGMARKKVLQEFRRRIQRPTYNIKRERPFHDWKSSHANQIVSRQPTPSEFAIARECWTSLMQGQPAHYQRIVQLRYEGGTYQEIAAEIGMNERTVRRVLQGLLKV